MSSSSRNTPGLAFVLFLAMAGFGSYLFTGGPLESSRPPSLTGTAGVSGEGRLPARLWQDPFRIVARQRAGEGTAGGRLRPLLAEIAQAAQGELRLMGVMVSTDAYAEVEERRRRRRYAVVSALAEAGYVPVDPGHLQLFTLGSATAVPVPFEWYRHDADPNRRVLLLWLDEGAFTDAPLGRLHTLLHALLAGDAPLPAAERERVRFFLVGPARSSTLRRMVAERRAGKAYRQLQALGLGAVDILSATATIPTDRLLPDRPGLSLDRFMSTTCDAGPCIRFRRLIIDDARTMTWLVQELNGARGVEATATNRLDGPAVTAGVILISELDTDFGRALPEIFLDRFCGDDAGCRSRVRRYHYLRGIDGKAPGSRDIGQAGAAQPADPLLALAEVEMPAVRRPVGPAQYDYLRRLADEIARLDRQWRRQTGRGVQAVGILGSDVYDKLLILRALRPRLSGTLFFTTDLDAALLHPAEIPWTRNLVVVSSHDLRLPADLQQRTPPFRTSYQSAVFLAVRAAMAPDPEAGIASAEQRVAYNPPAIFEIGLHGPVRFFSGTERGVAPPLHPPPPPRNLQRNWLLGLGLVLLGLVVLHQWRSRSRLLLHGVTIAAALLLGLAALAIGLGEQEEPFYLWSGVSAWPSLMLRTLATVLAVWFLCVALRDLGRGQRALDREWFGGRAAACGSGVAIVAADGWRWVLPMLPFAVAAGALTWYYPRHFAHHSVAWALLLWMVLFAGWFGLLRHRFRGHAIREWRSGGEGGQSARDLWHGYLALGTCRFRFARVMTVTLFFQAFIMVVSLNYGQDPLPLRGTVSTRVAELLVIASEFVMLFLLFFAVDASRLTRLFVRRLSRDRFREDEGAGWPPVLGMPPPLAGEWLRIRVIAEDTAVVNRLIYYPFIVIVLLVASRIGHFDNWGLPQGLAVIIAGTVLIAVLSALRLRQAAEQARGRILGRLERHHLAVVNGAETAFSEAQVERLREVVAAEQAGAFQPYLDQPVVRATLLLLGGVGASVSQFAGLLY